MTRSRFATAAALGGFATAWAGSAAARTAFSAEGATGSFLTLLTDRLEFTLKQIPALGQHLAALPDIVDGRTALLLLAVVAAGLAAEYIVRLLLNWARLKGFDRLVGHSPLRAFGRAVLLDVVALLALVVAARLVLPRIGDPQSVGGRLGQEVFQALLYWRFVQSLFRAWLRPEHAGGPHRAGRRCRSARPPGGVELGDRPAADRRPSGEGSRDHGRQPRRHRAAIILYAPLISAALLWVVWHWQKEMTAWLSAMVSEARSATGSSSTRRAIGGCSA